MQAPHRTDRGRTGVVDLLDVSATNGLGQIALTEKPRKCAAAILKGLGFRNKNTGKGGWKEFHARPPSRDSLP